MMAVIPVNDPNLVMETIAPPFKVGLMLLSTPFKVG